MSRWFWCCVFGTRGAISLLVVVLVAITSGQTSAQTSEPVIDSTKMGLSIDRVHWGWNGNSLAPERYSPVVVLVSSKDRAVTGVLTLEYPQDSSQVARVVTPFSTTPGRSVPVELVACPPQTCEWIRLTIDDGRRSEFRLYSNQSGSDSLPMPGTWSKRLRVGVLAMLRPVILRDESISAPEPAAVEGPPAPTRALPPLDNADIVRIDPAMLPTGWLAYQSLDVLVAREDELLKCDRRALDALSTWIGAGGRLLVQVSAEGSRVHELLPPDARACFELGSPAPILPGAEVGKTLRTAQTEPIAIPTAARLMRVTPEGKRLGWSVRWRAGDAGENDDAGMIVTGPAGLGIVAMIGVDPSRLPGVASDTGTRELWRDAVTPLLPHWTTTTQIDQQFGSYWGSGEDEETSTALRTLLDSVTTTPPIGTGFFFITLLAMGALILAVGPIGRIVLKRRGWLSSNWLAALACIGLASIAGAVVPLALRSGQTAVGRHTLVDAVVDDSGRIDHAWSSALTGVFAGKPGLMRVYQEPELAWSRGLSTNYSWRSSGSRFAPIELLYGLPGASQRDGLPMGPVPFSQWTFRAFLGHSIGAPACLEHLRVSTKGDSDDAKITIHGLPEGVDVRGAALHGRWFTWALTHTREDDGGITLRLGPHKLDRTALDRVRNPADNLAPYNADAITDVFQAPEQSLPVARARNTALQTLTSEGRGELLVLKLGALPLEVDRSSPSESLITHHMTLRLVLPATGHDATGDAP